MPASGKVEDVNECRTSEACLAVALTMAQARPPICTAKGGKKAWPRTVINRPPCSHRDAKQSQQPFT